MKGIQWPQEARISNRQIHMGSSDFVLSQGLTVYTAANTNAKPLF